MKNNTTALNENRLSVIPSIKINSLLVDLSGGADEVCTDKNNREHFSIRGYVSKMREKDWKRCSPFALDDNHDKPEKQTSKLHPLHSSKFRSWCCPICAREIIAEDVARDGPQTPIENSVNGIPISILDTSVNSYLTCADKKEKNSTGNEIQSDEIMTEEMPLLTNAAAEVISSTEVISIKNGSVESSKVGSDIREISCSKPDKRNARTINENSTGNLDMGNKTPLNFKHAELIHFDSPGLAGNMASSVDKRGIRKHPSIELDELDKASYEKAQVLVINGLDNQHHDNAARTHRRKPPKVRLLTELLGENEGFPSNVVSSALAFGTLSAPKNQLASHVTRDFGLMKKRKLPSDVEQNFQERTSPDVLSIDGIRNSGKESTCASGSYSEDLTLPELCLQSCTSKYRTNKKKNKNNQVDESLDLTLSLESLQNDSRIKTSNINEGNLSKNACPKSIPGALTSRKLAPCSVHDQETEGMSSLYKEKTNKSSVDDEHTVLHLCSHVMPSVTHATTRDIEVLPIKPLTIPCQPMESAFSEKRLDLSLDSFSVPQKNDKKITKELEDVLSISKHRQRGLKPNSVQDLCFVSKSKPVEGLPNKVVYDVDNKSFAGRTDFLSENEKYNPLIESGSSSQKQKKGACGGESSKVETMEMQEHSVVPRGKSDRLALDDVPMEIVELMAKNQYERCLPDVGSGKQPIQATNHVAKQILDLKETYGKGKLKLLKEETSSKSMLTENQNPVDYQNLYNMTQLGQLYAAKRISGHPNNPVKPVQCSASGSNKHSYSNNRQLIENMEGNKMNPPLSFSPLTTYETCQNSSELRKDSNLWPSFIQSRMPFEYGMQQKSVDQSIRKDVVPSWSTDWCNFSTSSIIIPEKHTQKLNSKSFSGIPPGPQLCQNNSSMGSLNLYYKETIPAMQLLSLMEAGFPIGKRIDLNGYLKRQPTLQDSTISSGEHKFQIYDFSAMNSQSTTSYGNVSAIPTAGAPISIQFENSLEKGAGFTDQDSRKTREKTLRKKSSSSPHDRGYTSKASPSANGDFNKNLGSVPVPVPVAKKKRLSHGAPDYLVLPSQSQGTKFDIKKKVGPEISKDTSSSLKMRMEPEVCCVNRNPADFSLGEERDAYMIHGEDLKYKKTNGYENNSSLLKLGKEHKRRKNHSKPHP